MHNRFRKVIAVLGAIASLTVAIAAQADGAVGVWEVAQPDATAHWQKTPVCPLVSGLPGEDGEFILGRISDIARTAGVPLAGDHCGANLYILVSSQPRELLKQMEARNRAFTFDSAGPSVVDNFIAARRPVKVWYNTHLEDAWGQIPTDAHAGVEDVPVVPTIVSRLTPAVKYGISRVFVVVDATQMHGVSRGQLADYVAMVGLVKFGAREHVGDAQSILTLFDRNASAVPQGMTDWDSAQLRSHYTR